MREFQLYSVGHALVDIFIDVNDDEFSSLGFERGTMRLVDADEQRQLLARFQRHDPRLISGGSVANSTFAFAQLGGAAALLGCVGDDRYGLFYREEFERQGVDVGNPVIYNATTGTCVCLITPDAERTMRTCLAVSSHVDAKHVDEARLSRSEWLFLEGFMFTNGEVGRAAVREAVRVAKKHGVKVAVTCSEAFVVQHFGDIFHEILAQTDLLFANASEAKAATGASDAASAFAALRSLVPSAVVTDGPHGAYVRYGGEETHVPAFACTPVDLTGAGDMLAGTFLYGITHGTAPRQALRAACYLATKVITQVGARLHHGVKEAWAEALA
ncbi:MAG: adenosine kinase [Planctomycetia bacterium]|nr:adenosine kinase [Planctomycetia bacterium]